METLIRGPRVLTMDDDGTEFESADILINGSTITAIGPDLAPSGGHDDAEVIDARGLLAMPGLVNGHLHSPANLMKGSLDDIPLELFMLYETPPFSDTAASQRLAYLRTMLGNIEMLKIGVTATHDDPFYPPVPSMDAVDGLMQAYVDSGMRAAVTLNQPNVVEYQKYPFLEEILPDEIREKMAAAPLMSADELIDLNKEYLRRWHGAENGRVKCAVSCSAPQRVTVEYLQGLSELSRTHDLPYDVHVLETKLQRVLGEERYGQSLVCYLQDKGVLDERVMIIHAIWVDDRDIELMGDSGCAVAHNPLCNLKIGSGVMPYRQLREHGIPICLGSDEASCDDTANMWGVAKLAGLVHKITDPEYRNWPNAREILHMVIRGGARAMRLEGQTGLLAPGYQADLILVDLNTLAFTPLNNLERQLVFCENGSSVVMTMVAGEVVVRDGEILTVDEEEIKREVHEMMSKERAGMAKAHRAAQELEPYYREMYLRAARRDVGINRWVGDAWRLL